MNLTGLKAVEFEGSLIGVSYASGDEVVGIPISKGNRGYQAVLDAIIAEGADCFTGDIPTELQTAADAKLFAQQLADYKTATARLAQYLVAEGRNQVIESQPTGEQVWNEDTGEMVDVMLEVIVQTAIEPVPATVEQTTYDEEGNGTTSTITNPLITTDVAERTAAQAVVDATPQPVKDAV